MSEIERLNMQTKNLAEEKLKQLKELFPNAVTEIVNDEGEVVPAIDKDTLMQEISSEVVEGNKERYQFTWPNKREAVLVANAPTSNTLRPGREESVNFDETENLYIEGDNLEVLKQLQETYLGKVDVIYIDPPYNTGNDFVYKDDFKSTINEYTEASGQYDEAGNRLETNYETHGRFHTNWLNMIYSRLKLARNLLSNEGIIFISIDDNEQANLKKICDEIFGEENLINSVSVKMSELSGLKMSNIRRYPKLKEYLLIYAKDIRKSEIDIEKTIKEDSKLENYLKYYNSIIVDKSKPVSEWQVIKVEDFLKAKDLKFDTKDKLNQWKLNNADRIVYRTNSRTVDKFINENPNHSYFQLFKNNEGKEIIKWDNKEMLFLKNYIEEYLGDMWNDISTINLNKENMGLNYFKNGQKPLKLIKRIIAAYPSPKLILDFFAGSSTTAHAVMSLNAEDGGNRKFIMVQLPEKTGEKSEANKAGYENIADIGKERIRRAGQKILEENKDKSGIENLDIGFRVLKLDSSNMKDVYYTPEDTDQNLLDLLEDNIKEDRTSEDLLFQVMLELGVPLSSTIEKEEIAGKEVLSVEGGFLVACFDKDMNEETVKAIAERNPYYAVFRDSSMANDSVATNFDQIFESISPETIRRVV